MNPCRQSLLYQLALALAVASGVFVALLTGLLGYNTIRGKVSTLVNSKQVVRLHDELRRQPKNEELKQRIRQLDLQLRQETFYRLRLSHNASRALIGGLVVFLVAAHHARSCRRLLPDPLTWGARAAEDERRANRFARYSVAVVFALVAFAAVLASLRPAQLPEQIVVVAEVPTTAEEFRQQWPAFRGAEGQGVAADATATLPWKIRWKTPVPLHGMSSPIIWSNAVFLTGATATENRVFRFDSETGALVWSAAVNAPKPPAPKVGDDTGFAAPTPVTDRYRVYAIFGDGLVAAFDHDGKQKWTRNVGPLDNAYGYASSLALHQDRLLIQIDRGQPEDGLSKLVALDTRTGREAWQQRRDVAGSWASPVVLTVNGQPQLITYASPFVIAYNPADGAELWRNKCLEGDVAPSPILAGNVLVAAAPNTAIYGLRPGTTNILWKAEDGVPDATSPVSDGERFYVVNAEGLLTCFDLQTGKVLWMHELDEHFYASPTLAGRTLVKVSRKGIVHLAEAGASYRALGKFELGEECNASPVPRGNRLYIRGKQNLFCIETAGKQ
jgi:outer membrane protein assembly factor BamB